MGQIWFWKESELPGLVSIHSSRSRLCQDVLVCRCERNHNEEANWRTGTAQLSFLFRGVFLSHGCEGNIGMHDTKQTIPHRLLKLTAQSLYPFLTVVWRSVCWLPKLLFSNTVIMGIVGKLKHSSAAHPGSTCLTDDRRDAAPLIWRQAERVGVVQPGEDSRETLEQASGT